MAYYVVRAIYPLDMKRPHRVSYIRRSLKWPRKMGVVFMHAWSPVYGWHEYSLNIWVHIYKGITFKVVI